MPRDEFDKLVGDLDKTIDSTIKGIKLDEIEESFLTKDIEGRIGQYFSEFSKIYQDEDITKAKEVAVSGIPNYIQAAKKLPEYWKKYRKILLTVDGCLYGGGSLCVAGIVSAIGLNNNALYILGLPFENVLFLAGAATFTAGLLVDFVGDRSLPGYSFTKSIRFDNPLAVYREQYRNQIIDAYKK